MTPDPATIVHSRYWLTAFLRLGVCVLVGVGLYCAWECAMRLLGGIDRDSIMWGVITLEPLVAAVLLRLLERPIIRWVLPITPGGGNESCPACGYSLKNLKS